MKKLTNPENFSNNYLSTQRSPIKDLCLKLSKIGSKKERELQTFFILSLPFPPNEKNYSTYF